jgi:hypothetical protein
MTLAGLPDKDFADKFSETFLQCKYALTGSDAVELARTHCSDIRRDVRRISFKAAKLLRTELGQWKNIDQSFAQLLDADRTFLKDFAESLRRIDLELDAIYGLVDNKKLADAQQRYAGLKKALREDVEALRTVTDRLKEAEDHIRDVLT